MYHVIVADDTDSARGLVARIVARTYPSVRITAVADGDEALDVFDREGAHLLITNNQMQRMHGLALIIAIRSRNPRVAIIMVSNDISFESLALASGANIFIAKPFTVQILTRALLSVLPNT